MSSNNVTLKVSLGESVRRITVARTSTWRELTQQLALLYQLPSTSGVTLRYKDEDGDDITVSSDIELAGLLQDAKTETVKFDVIVPGYKPRPASPEPLAEPLSPSPESSSRAHVAAAGGAFVYPPPSSSSSEPVEKNFDYHMAQFEKHMRDALQMFEHEVKNAGNRVSMEYGKFKENNPDIVTKVQSASQKVVNEVKHVFDELFGNTQSQATVVPLGGATVVPIPPPPHPQYPTPPPHPEHPPHPPRPEHPQQPAEPYRVPQPVAVDELESKINMLNEMGFTNNEANRDLLMQYQGDVNMVVEVLTEQNNLQQELSRP